jgi:peptidoglycan/xylan/chitin deacetylase (PgdA/CDA1 family)
MRELGFLLLRVSGLPFLAREVLQRRRVSILCYRDPSPAVLEAHLHALGRRYRFIPLARYLEWRVRPELHLPRHALVLSVDGGHKRNYRLKDVFRRHGVRPTLFLCSEIVGTRRHYWWRALPAEERRHLTGTSDAARREALARAGFDETLEYAERQALSASEIEALKSVVDFQSHTRFQPVLPRCSDERAAEEIRMSKVELERRYGVTVQALAYPDGEYSAREVELARRAGYQYALTADGGYNTRMTDSFRLRRIRIPDDAGPNEVTVRASGLASIWSGTVGARERRAPAVPDGIDYAGSH